MLSKLLGTRARPREKRPLRPERGGGNAARRFAFTLIAILTLFAWATPVISLSALPGALSASAASPVPGTPLGGLNLDLYCQGLGYDHSDVIDAGLTSPPNIGPGAAFDWACIAPDGSTLPSPYQISRSYGDMYLPCEAEYPNQSAAPLLGDPNDAYSWTCVVASGSTPPPGAEITGRVCISSEPACPGGGPNGGVDKAPVTACATNVSTPTGTVPFFCVYTVTAGGGFYAINNLPQAVFTVTADPPPGTNATANQVGNIAVGTSGVVTANIILPATSAPTTSGIEGSFGTTTSPTIDSTWSSYTFDTFGCPGGTFNYKLTLNTAVTTKTASIPAGTVIASGQMTQVSSDGTVAHFQAVDGRPLSPAKGKATLTFTFKCPGGVTGTSATLPIYIDPSGTVVNQLGNPISGATVTLYYSPIDAAGPYAAVPDGSTLMDPGNRTNPTTTGSDGTFGWDVLPGFYKVVATRAGCTGPTLDQSTALSIPPAVTGITLKLKCSDTKQPKASITSAPSLITTANTAKFAFKDKNPDGSTNATFECKLDFGVFTPCTSAQSYTGLTVGLHLFQVHATDAAGNTSDSAIYIWAVLPTPGRK